MNNLTARLTGTALDQTQLFFMPWQNGRPLFSEDILRASAEMAADTYALDDSQWTNAGWQDVSVQIDGSVISNMHPDEDAGTLGKLRAGFNRLMAKARIAPKTLAGNAVGAIRQIDRSRTGKAMIMIRPNGDGRFVVAVSFMGTSSHMEDWVGNMRMATESGCHRGFLELTRQFEANEESIRFPETAEALGLPDLTLRDIVTECAQENSRFVLWLSGHSQGAALMQLWAREKIRVCGVQPRNIIGYGFASPSVVTGTADPDPSDYPLFHIISSDDVVPRVGCEMHLGTVMMYTVDRGLQQACYTVPGNLDQRIGRAYAKAICDEITDTTGGCAFVYALCRVLAGKQPEELLTLFHATGILNIPKAEQIIDAAGPRIVSLIGSTAHRVAAAAESITGQPIPVTRVGLFWGLIEKAEHKIGFRELLEALKNYMTEVHACRPTDEHPVTPYIYIALHGISALRPAFWQPGHPPVLCCGQPASASADAGFREEAQPAGYAPETAVRRREYVSRTTRRYSEQRRSGAGKLYGNRRPARYRDN